MAGFLERIKDDRAVLLMYLADELDAADRAEVERRLDTETIFHAELEHVKASYSTFIHAMHSLDEAQPLPVPEEAAVGRTQRLVRQWITRRMANPPAQRVVSPLMPRWAMQLAAAAALLVAVIWWGIDRHGRLIGLPSAPDPRSEFMNTVQELSSDQQEALLGASAGRYQDTENSLDRADNAVASISAGADSDVILSGLGDSDDANTSGGKSPAIEEMQ